MGTKSDLRVYGFLPIDKIYVCSKVEGLIRLFAWCAQLREADSAKHLLPCSYSFRLCHHRLNLFSANDAVCLATDGKTASAMNNPLDFALLPACLPLQTTL